MRYEMCFDNYFCNETEIIHIEAKTKAQAYLIGQAAMKKRQGDHVDPYIVPHLYSEKVYTVDDLNFTEEKAKKMLDFAIDEAEILDIKDLLPDEY